MHDTDQHLSEEQLVKRLQTGDREAVGILYDRYAAALYGVIFRVIQVEEVAEDTLQEVFVKIWKKVGSYDKSKGRLFTWMLRIARNKAIDVARSASFRKQKTTDTIDNQNSPKNLGQTKDTTDTIGLKEIVTKLKPEYKEVIDLAYFGGYTQAEIAKELELPLGTVKSRIRIGLRELRKMMS